MKTLTNKKLCVIMILLFTVLFSLFAVLKSYLFLDETYSYCMSNGSMPPFCAYGNGIKGDTIIDKVVTKQEFYDLVSASDNKFDYKNVYNNLLTDVHPPLYGYMLHTVSSLFDGGGKYKALALGFIIQALTLFFLYKLAKRLFGSDMIALITVILYGLSRLGMSNALMVRMYILLTLFTVLLTYIVVLLIQTGKRYLYPLFSLVIFLGLYTQYYFAIYAAILCAGACIYMLIKKQYKRLICFVIFGFLGIGLMCLVFPNILNVIFKRQDSLSGKQMLNNLAQVLGDQESAAEQKAIDPNYTSQYVKMLFFAGFASLYMLLASFVGIASIALIIKNGKRKDVLSFLRKDRNVHWALIVIVPTFISLFLISVISPHVAERYIYHISPMLALTAGFAVYILQNATDKQTFLQKPIFPLVLMALSVVVLFIKVPNYIYPEYIEYNKIIDEYSDAPCIYLDENINHPLTNDMPQLMKFNDVFVTNDTNSQAMKDYLNKYGNPDEIIVYIDTNKKLAVGYDAEEKLKELSENTEYRNHEKLFSTFLSDAYKVSK